MLIPCATVVTDRAQGLRRMAEFVVNVVPELGNQSFAAVSFYFTHVDKLGSVHGLGDPASKLDAARKEVYAWLEDVWAGTDRADESRRHSAEALVT